MKLAFYSDTIEGTCKEFDEQVALLIGKENPKFTYIPSSSDRTRKYLNRSKEYFSRFGYSNFEYFDVDEEFNNNHLTDLLLSDVILLSGGNTFNFLNNLKSKGMDKVLTEYAKMGSKVLIGVSAGSMIMTPTIANTAFHHKIKGDFEELNKVNLKDFTGLSLVGFEFIPHFSEYKEQALWPYLSETKNTVYACYDGSGILVNDGVISTVGKVVKLN